MKDINTIIEEIAKKHSLTYIVAKYAYENNYFSINQFLDLGRDLTSEKSLEIINYFAKFDNGREVDPTLLKLASFRMEDYEGRFYYPSEESEDILKFWGELNKIASANDLKYK